MMKAATPINKGSDASLNAIWRFQELPGNVDKDTVVSHVLTPQIMARYFRFRPRTWQERVSMRVELYGCPGAYFIFSNINVLFDMASWPP